MSKVEIHPPLVSIIVVTYNSSQFVLETLESAKAQTYQNIELIVTDDGSKDNTVEICRDWMEKNQHRFVRTEIITVEQNTGISPNCNRGFHSAHGDWVKPIAGDDILNPHCIDSFIFNIGLHPDTFFFFSNIDIFGAGENSKKGDFVRKWIDKSIKRADLLTTSQSQYYELMINNIISAPSAFYQLKAFNSLGGFDEEIKLMEDYPFWIKATKNGYKLKAIKENLVRYRMNENSIQKSSSYKIAYELFLQKYIFKNALLYLLINSIDQLNIGPKDKLLCYLLKFTSLPQRGTWRLKKKIQNDF